MSFLTNILLQFLFFFYEDIFEIGLLSLIYHAKQMFKIKLLVIINYLAFISWPNWTVIKPSSFNWNFLPKKRKANRCHALFLWGTSSQLCTSQGLSIQGHTLLTVLLWLSTNNSRGEYWCSQYSNSKRVVTFKDGAESNPLYIIRTWAA